MDKAIKINTIKAVKIYMNSKNTDEIKEKWETWEFKFFLKYGLGHNSSRGVAKTKWSGVAERNENLQGNSEKEEEVLSNYKWVFVEF